jgi:class 3 adenylate cyclase
MRFDDDWQQRTTLDAYSIGEDELRFDRVARCTIVCTDIVGGARLFEAMPEPEFMALLADYLVHVRGVFGREPIYHTLRDDIFITLEGERPDALDRARAFVEAMRELPFECSVGIASGDVAIVTRGEAVESQGAAVAIAKGLAKIAAARAIFIDEDYAEAIDAATHVTLARRMRVRLPHVGQARSVREVLGRAGELGIKQRFVHAPRLDAHESFTRV